VKILHVILNLGYGGAESMLVKLVNQDKVNEIVIITLMNYSPLKDKIENRNVTVIPAFRKKLSFVADFLNLIRKVRSFKPDIIQSWMYHSELMGLVLKRSYPRAKLFWNIRCSTSEWLKLRFRNKIIFKMLLRGSHKVSGIIVNSHIEYKESVLLGYPEEKLIYIPNGFESVEITDKINIRNELLTKFNLASEATLIGAVTKNSVLKDIDTLLKAFQLIKIQLPLVNLILVGSGFDTDFREKLADMRLIDNVHIYGTTNNIFKVIPGFDIAVLSSKTESFPNVIAEYMLASLPVVSTNVADIPEIVGDYGIVVPPNDPESLSNALISVFNMSYEEKAVLGKNARERILEIYPINKIFKSYLDKYREKLEAE
jgi:glycosyltransferase involved in cell wall biosynthesis